MWRPTFSRAFLKALKKLEEKRKNQAKEAVQAFLFYLETMDKSHGLGLRKLKGNVWEIRVNISDRILFELDDDRRSVDFLMLGNHDEIRRFIKHR